MVQGLRLRAANVELAEAVAPHAHRAAPAELMQKSPRPAWRPANRLRTCCISRLGAR